LLVAVLLLWPPQMRDMLAATVSFFPATHFSDDRNLIWTAFSGPTPALLGVALMVGPLTLIVFVADGYRLCYRFRGAPIGLRRPPVMILYLVIIVLAPYVVDLHGVRKIPGPLPIRPDLVEAYQNWQSACGKQARPVVVALSGGAARSALWGASVMARLDTTIATFPAGGRPAAIFAISTVSGGSLGAAAYLAVRARQGDDSPCSIAAGKIAPFRIFAKDFLAADAIGPLLAGFVLSDMPRALIGGVPALLGADLRGGDRAAAIERAFERNAFRAAERTGIAAMPLDAPYLSLIVRNGMPLWIANATDRDNGRRVLAAPFQFDTQDPGAPFSGAIDMLNVAGADLPISTVVNATARFPFIEPPGDIATVGVHDTMAVIDGGYYDDSGLETALNLTDWLRRQGADPILVAVNGDGESKGTSGIGSTENANEILRCDAPNPPNLAHGPPSAELLAPLIGVYEARAAHVDMLLRRARALYCVPGDQSFFQFYLGALGSDPVPLNWVLSKRMADHVWRSSGVEPVPQALRDEVINGNIEEGEKFAAALKPHLK